MCRLDSDRLEVEGRSWAELHDTLQLRLFGGFKRFVDEELRAVLALLAGPGMIASGLWWLHPAPPGGAQSLRRRRGAEGAEPSARFFLDPTTLTRPSGTLSHSRGRGTGCIRQDELLAGDLDYQVFKRLPHEDEAVVLRTLLETFVSRAW